ncbi:site-2 protease family protein [Streptomyces sp. H27-D2]|uniref:site-2 protease family protein n=1 Tax=Streptomyces sp. H27-D2 TaxID=3046304 RepID=UPI002DB59EA4|nr:site-2 protease family protein [Streptomyces sp. H27-D2]MEC4016681.1 site-2 protease family protein [Streptomyces sp. H27-D2]
MDESGQPQPGRGGADPATEPEGRQPGNRTPEDAGPHERASEERTPAEHGSPERSPQDRAARDQAPQERTPGERKPPRRPKRPREAGGGILMGRPFGVPVYVAPSWFVVAALITWVFGGQLDRVLPELGNARYLVALFFAVAFYASVLIHELAHTVAALRFGLPVRRIQLQFFGGVSEIEKESETPGREFVLAFVGPLLSLVLSGVFYLGMLVVEAGTVPGVLLAGLMISNLIVAAFNLLPGLPLDGGRMLRAVVWKLTGNPMTGTTAAAWTGRALAVTVLIGLPLLTHTGALGDATEDISGVDTLTDALLAAILAAIIWTGAGNSLRMARLRERLPGLRARTLTRRAVPVEAATPLSEALRRANEAGARALVVVDGHGDPTAVVREAAIVGVPEHRRPWVAVSGLAQDLKDGMRVSAELSGEDLLETLRAAPATEYLVLEETGEIYGVLSTSDVERAFVAAMARPQA